MVENARLVETGMLALKFGGTEVQSHRRAARHQLLKSADAAASLTQVLIAFNSTVVFAEGAIRWIGLAITAALVVPALRRARRGALGGAHRI